MAASILKDFQHNGTFLTTGNLTPTGHYGVNAFTVTGLANADADFDTANDYALTNLDQTWPGLTTLPIYAVTTRRINTTTVAGRAIYRRDPNLIKPTQRAWTLTTRRTGQATIQYWVNDNATSNDRPAGLPLGSDESPLSWPVPTITFSMPTLLTVSPTATVDGKLRKINSSQVYLAALGNDSSTTGTSNDFLFPAKTLYFAGWTETPVETTTGTMFRVWYHFVYTKSPGWVTKKVFYAIGATVYNHDLYDTSSFAGAFPVHSP